MILFEPASEDRVRRAEGRFCSLAAAASGVGGQQSGRRNNKTMAKMVARAAEEHALELPGDFNVPPCDGNVCARKIPSKSPGRWAGAHVGRRPQWDTMGAGCGDNCLAKAERQRNMALCSALTLALVAH